MWENRFAASRLCRARCFFQIAPKRNRILVYASTPLHVNSDIKRGYFFIYARLPISVGLRLINGLSIRSSSRAHFSRNSPFSFQRLRFSSINESRCSSTFSSLLSSLAHRTHGSKIVASGCVMVSWWLIGVSLECIGPRPKMSQSVLIPKVFVNKSIVAKFSSLLFFS